MRALQLLALSLLLASLGAISIIFKIVIRDPDVWWHLKVGDWIVQHHAVPHVGIFSRTAGTRPWIAYSWAYEVLLSRAYAWFGLMGIAVFGVVLTVAVAAIFFWMVHRLSGNFWTAWIVSAVGCLAFLYSLMPRPVFFSMLFFAVTLTFIFEAERTCRIQLLYALPLVFLVWANFHIQFIYGLAVLGLFTGMNLLHYLANGEAKAPAVLRRPTLPPAKLTGLFAACALAACIGPYSYHVYQVVFTYSQSRAAYFLIEELQAPNFKYFTDYFLLLLTTAGFFVLGWRKDVNLFKLALLSIASIAAFRTSRDAFFVSICAAACIADFFATKQDENWEAKLKLREVAGVGMVIVLLLLLVARNTDFTVRELDRSISQEYPVDAVNFLRRNPVPGPLYNHLNWGGFLTWYMPNQPVSIDGRNDLYGDEFDVRSFQTANGESYDADPDLNAARLVLLPKAAPLAAILSNDPKYQLIYEDQLSVVLVRRRP
ncbi:MAG: hypothetical protein ACE14M_01340 [Terriglobales bacterium]